MSERLATRYLGLSLKSPLVVGACPLTADEANILCLEDSGAAAVVLPSLNLSQLESEQLGLAAVMDGPADGYAEALGYFAEDDLVVGPDVRLEQLAKLKPRVEIPIIASITGTADADWASYGEAYGKQLCQAGADAIELNLGLVPADPNLSAADVEQKLLAAVSQLNATLSVPLAVKLPPWFSGLAHFASQLEQTGCTGAVLFSRFQDVRVNIEQQTLSQCYSAATPSEYALRLRWLAILSAQRNLDLAVSGGVRNRADVIAALMAGANAVQLVSELLEKGAGRLTSLLGELHDWLDAEEYSAISQLQCSMNIDRCPDPSAYLMHEPVADLMRHWRHRG